MPLPVYQGRFGTAEAERLLWRAGFGPRRGEARRVAALGLADAVHSLTNPRAERWVGPTPHDEKGHRLTPADAWGHDHLWWLDRMVRTSRPLVERMTLVWHDWFATSNDGVGSQKLMLAQNRLLRRNALGRFDRLLVEITANPAMLLWLSGTDNRKGAPNENYGRELMELFTLGEGNGYTEHRAPPDTAPAAEAHRQPAVTSRRRRTCKPHTHLTSLLRPSPRTLTSP